MSDASILDSASDEQRDEIYTSAVDLIERLYIAAVFWPCNEDLLKERVYEANNNLFHALEETFGDFFISAWQFALSDWSDKRTENCLPPVELLRSVITGLSLITPSHVQQLDTFLSNSDDFGGTR